MAEIKVTYELKAPANVSNNQLEVLDLSIGDFNILPQIKTDLQTNISPITYKNTNPFSIFPINQFTPVTAIVRSLSGFVWTLNITFENGLGTKFSADPIEITANINGIGLFNQSIKWRK